MKKLILPLSLFSAITLLPGCTSLTDVVMKNDAFAVEKMLSEGENPNGADNDCYSPLMISAAAGNITIMKLLIQKGAKVNARSPQCYKYGSRKLPIKNNTALMFARNTTIVKLLLKHKADINAANHPDGKTALTFAVRRQNYRVVKFLVSAGADIKKNNLLEICVHSYRFPYLRSIIPGRSLYIEIARFLIARGLKPEGFYGVKKGRKMYDLLKAAGAKE